MKSLITYIKSNNTRIYVLILYICQIPLFIGFILNNNLIMYISTIGMLITGLFSLVEYIQLMKNNPEVKQEIK